MPGSSRSTMWSNFLRFVDDGIAVGELLDAAGCRRGDAVDAGRRGAVAVRFVGGPADRRGEARRLGKRAWPAQRVGRAATPAGRTRGDLARAVRRDRGAVARSGSAPRRLPLSCEALRPWRGSTRRCPSSPGRQQHATAWPLELPSVENQGGGRRIHLVTLLSQALLAYTLDFEAGSRAVAPAERECPSRPRREGRLGPELPALVGISKEAVEVALTSCEDPLRRRRGRARSEANGPADARRERSSRRIERRLHADSESDGIARRSGMSLERILDHPDLSARARAVAGRLACEQAVRAQTEAMLDDPAGRYPTTRWCSIAAAGRTAAERQAAQH